MQASTVVLDSIGGVPGGISAGGECSLAGGNVSFAGGNMRLAGSKVIFKIKYHTIWVRPKYILV